MSFAYQSLKASRRSRPPTSTRSLIASWGSTLCVGSPCLHTVAAGWAARGLSRAVGYLSSVSVDGVMRHCVKGRVGMGVGRGQGRRRKRLPTGRLHPIKEKDSKPPVCQLRMCAARRCSSSRAPCASFDSVEASKRLRRTSKCASLSNSSNTSRILRTHHSRASKCND